MGKKIEDKTTVTREGDSIRVTRKVVEDLSPDEYLSNLNALIIKVNEYTDNLLHDTLMRDEWVSHRPLALEIRDELMEKDGIDKSKIPAKEMTEMKGGHDKLQEKIAALKEKRAGKVTK